MTTTSRSLLDPTPVPAAVLVRITKDKLETDDGRQKLVEYALDFWSSPGLARVDPDSGPAQVTRLILRKLESRTDAASKEAFEKLKTLFGNHIKE